MGINIPLQIAEIENDGFHLMVEVFVLGVSGMVVVDTGASRTVFDKTFVELHQPHLLSESDVNATALFSSTPTLLATFDDLSIGSQAIPNLPVVVLDLSNIIDTYSQYNLPAIIGILGGDVLMQFNAIINYQEKTLQLNPNH